MEQQHRVQGDVSAHQEPWVAGTPERVRQADVRLRTMAATIRASDGRRDPDLILEHRMFTPHDDFDGKGYITRDQLRAISLGDPCPEHGSGCVVEEIERASGLLRTRKAIRCQTEAWVLRHECPQRLHRDLYHTNAHLDSSVRLVAITIGGHIALASTFDLPIGQRPVRLDLLIVNADRNKDVLQGYANTAGMYIGDYMDSLSDQIEVLLSGGAAQSPDCSQA